MISVLLIFSQSFFSTRGLGEDILVSDAVMEAYGKRVSLSLLNPAYPSQFPLTSFFLTGLGGAIYAQEDNRERALWDIRPQTFIALIPLPYSTGISLGISESFNQSFDIFSDSISVSGISYQHHVKGRGGIYRGYIGGCKSLFNHISIGLEYNYLFGGSTEEWMLKILGGEYLTHDSCKAGYSGDYLKTGILIHTKFLSFGGLCEMPGRLNISTCVKTVAKTDSFKVKGSLPLSYGFGLKVSPKKGVELSFDYFKRVWKDKTIGGVKFKDSDKYSIGIGYKYWRLGYYRMNWSSLTIENRPIREEMVSIGYPLPLKPWGVLQLCGGAGKREGENLREWIGRVGFTLFFQEPWKKRKRKWGW